MVCAALVALAAPASTQVPEIPSPDLSLDEILDIIDVELPPLGESLQVHLDYPAEAPLEIEGVNFYSLTITVTSEGAVEIVNSIEQGAATGEGAGKPCVDDFYKRTGVTWASSDVPVKWTFGRASVPNNLSKRKTLKVMKASHQAWPNAVSNCSDRPANDFGFEYDGASGKGIERDGTNTVRFGDLDGPLALNYIWFVGGEIREADVRFNTDYSWTTNPKSSRKYQVKEVATHEMGHQVGLDDLGDPHGGLTMFGRIGKGDLKKTTLGKGDLRGARANYSP